MSGTVAGFHGSYAPDDVTFLLQPMDLQPVDVRDKERWIQLGVRHYSEMLSDEPAPAPGYQALFVDAAHRNGGRLAFDIAALASAIAAQSNGQPVAIVSLARAGTPVGVVVTRALRKWGLTATHYSVSILRDRGIDEAALDAVRARHPDEAVFVIDGWTGKGAISRELQRSVARYNAARGAQLSDALWAVADLAGTAAWASTDEDYLIPSAVLNSTVSGLISRTVDNDDVRARGGFHACRWLQHLAPLDQSRWFVDHLAALLPAEPPSPRPWPLAHRSALAQQNRAWLDEVAQRYAVENPHHIKVGVGEATRALLRRVPERLLVRDPANSDVAHLIRLASEGALAIEAVPGMPYLATVVLASMGTEP